MPFNPSPPKTYGFSLRGSVLEEAKSPSFYCPFCQRGRHPLGFSLCHTSLDPPNNQTNKSHPKVRGVSPSEGKAMARRKHSVGFWAWVLGESLSSQGTLGFLRSKRDWAAGFLRVLISPPLRGARPGTGVPKHWGLEGVRALEPRVLVNQFLSPGKTQPGISENPSASSRGRIRVSAEKAGESARGGALKEDARGSDYLSGAGPWVAGAGPGGPGAPGGSHNADIPEPS